MSARALQLKTLMRSLFRCGPTPDNTIITRKDRTGTTTTDSGELVRRFELARNLVQ